MIAFPLFPRRRVGAAAVLAAAVLVVGLGIGYAWGHAKAPAASFTAERIVPMHGRGALAVLRIAKADAVGNWPMQLQVTGLPAQQARDASYELWLTKNGKPEAYCGAFRVHGKTTTVRLSVPYSFRDYDGWVVTAEPPGASAPGRVVLTT